jgi:hypothetical protein
MDIEAKIEESKKRTNLINAITIEWQYAQQIAPQVLNSPVQTNAEFQTLCANLNKICTNIEEGIREMKAMIPNI